ncbi:hypothetical protein HN011_009902 [Eciton burchellii]|nr:hypothetical protein HN011_009902 [Eciton burchellii]
MSTALSRHRYIRESPEHAKRSEANANVALQSTDKTKPPNKENAPTTGPTTLVTKENDGGGPVNFITTIIKEVRSIISTVVDFLNMVFNIVLHISTKPFALVIHILVQIFKWLFPYLF